MKLIHIALLAGSAFALPAMAQSQEPAPQAADATGPTGQTGIADIVVTANRVQTSAQKTAVAINVYSGADLVSRGISNVTALTASDPSINITTTTDGSYLAIRGVASTDTTQVGDPSVPIARDGFYTNRQFGLQSSMYDVARIEVLKGPQGTLNGRNSTGGLVSIITTRPKFENSGYVNAELGTYSTFNGEAGLNYSPSDKLAFRASGIYRRHDGYRRLSGINVIGDDEDMYSGRFQIAARPTENLSLNLLYQHDDLDSVGSISWKTPIGQRPDFGKARIFPGFFKPYNRLIVNRVQWEARLDDVLGNLSVIYAGGRDSTTFRHALDGTSDIYPAVRTYINNERPVTWNHELRISNDPVQRLFVQAGYFHFYEKNAIINGLYNVSMTGPFAPGGPFAALSTAGRYGVYFDNLIVTTSDAAFAQGAFAATDQLKLTLGARLTWDKKTRTGTNITDIQAVGSPFAPPVVVTGPADGIYPFNGKRKPQASFHAGIDFTPSDQILLYGKYDRGYKAGGFNSPDNGQPVPGYQPETIDSFEVGAKTKLMGGRLIFNVDGFYFNYSNYQGSQYTQTGSGSAGTFNVGSARVYGAEVQASALFGAGGRFDLNAALLNTKMGDNIIIANGASPPELINVGGNRLPNAPSAVITATVEYAIPMMGGHVTPHVDAKYSSKFYYSVFNYEDETSRSYVMANANVTFEPDSRNWQISFFVRNLTDHVVLTSGKRNYLAGINEYVFQPPRTYGVRTSLKF